MNWFQKRCMGLWEDIEKQGPPQSDRFSLEGYRRRIEFLKNFGYAIPSKESIEHLNNFVGTDAVLEVGAGRGLWAKLMQDIGMDVTATDQFSGRIPSDELSENLVHEDNPYWKPEADEKFDRSNFTDVIQIEGIEAIGKFLDKNVLLMIWPPYDEPMATDMVKAFIGNKLILIGEGHGGCTGANCLWELLEQEWNFVEKVDIPQWAGMHDRIMLYTRK